MNHTVTNASILLLSTTKALPFSILRVGLVVVCVFTNWGNERYPTL